MRRSGVRSPSAPPPEADTAPTDRSRQHTHWWASPPDGRRPGRYPDQRTPPGTEQQRDRSPQGRRPTQAPRSAIGVACGFPPPILTNGDRAGFDSAQPATLPALRRRIAHVTRLTRTPASPANVIARSAKRDAAISANAKTPERVKPLAFLCANRPFVSPRSRDRTPGCNRCSGDQAGFCSGALVTSGGR